MECQGMALQWSGKGLWWLLGKGRRRFAVAAVVVVVAVRLRQYYQKQQRRKRWARAGKDVVVLHMFQRAKICPSFSPFAIKLETYLRMAGITYEVDYEEPFGPKGKGPWITLNGEELADSQLIMERLGEKFNKDFSSHLTQEEKAVAHAFRTMLEDHTMWIYAYWRYVLDKGRAVREGVNLPFLPTFTIRFVAGKVRKMCWLQGIGRHSPTEIEVMGRQDLAALSAYLQEKDFLMGKQPTEVDCAVFGILSQMMYVGPGSPYFRMLQHDFPNLKGYTFRVREKFWPDWNACLDPPQPVP